MKATKLLLFPLLFAAMATMPQGAMSQVTIGADEPPQSFSVLELISNSKGLRLPQLTTLQRKALSDAHGTEESIKGLTVYNTIKNCVEYWNGTEWIPAPAGACLPAVDFPDLVGCNQSIPPVTFMAYNLGADPTLDTPKKQMQYLATHIYDPLDATVYGGWFQWGRGYDTDQALPEDQKKGWKHAVDLTHLPARLRYAGDTDGVGYNTSNSIGIPGGLTAGNFDATTGQPSNATVATQFIRNTTSYDWLNVSNNNLWGNGKLVTEETPGSGVICDGCTAPPDSPNGKYFQSTAWGTVAQKNNPCPSGFRVPTQDEWERIGAYDCRPNSAGGLIATSNSATSLANNNLTWVPVVCGIGSNITNVKCQANSTPWSETPGSETRSGYAIYTTADWTANSSYTTDLTNPAAKEPLLFLPAASYRDELGSQKGLGGYYWSSTVGAGSLSLSFGSAVVYSYSYNYRVLGLSLRCVAE